MTVSLDLDPATYTIEIDGRNYLMTTSETYDVIVLEPPETFTAGVINLYTTEFYRDAHGRLCSRWVDSHDVLAVMQMTCASSNDVHCLTLTGPKLQFRDLPYRLTP